MRKVSNPHVAVTKAFFAAAILPLLFISTGHAQNFTSLTDGSTPSALTPGAPAGAYALSGFENINLYNGNLNFALPLLHIGGRGGAEHTMMLTIEQHWRIRKPKPTATCELPVPAISDFRGRVGGPPRRIMGQACFKAASQA